MIISRSVYTKILCIVCIENYMLLIQIGLVAGSANTLVEPHFSVSWINVLFLIFT